MIGYYFLCYLYSIEVITRVNSRNSPYFHRSRKSRGHSRYGLWNILYMNKLPVGFLRLYNQFLYNVNFRASLVTKLIDMPRSVPCVPSLICFRLWKINYDTIISLIKRVGVDFGAVIRSFHQRPLQIEKKQQNSLGFFWSQNNLIKSCIYIQRHRVFTLTLFSSLNLNLLCNYHLHPIYRILNLIIPLIRKFTIFQYIKIHLTNTSPFHGKFHTTTCHLCDSC